MTLKILRKYFHDLKLSSLTVSSLSATSELIAKDDQVRSTFIHTPELITTSDTYATVHNAIFSLSSLENNYFKGEVTNGLAVTQFEEFDRAHFTQVQQFTFCPSLRTAIQ